MKSNMNSIQDSFRRGEIVYVALASQLYSVLPSSGKILITIDRSEWDFGRKQLNILMAGQGDFQIPIYW